MIGSSRTYAIGMAHFQLSGGWKSLLSICCIYLLLFFGGLSLYLYADASAPPGRRAGLTSLSIVVLLVLETFVLLIFGSNRISACIRLDLSSKMIESHRLMPIPAWRAVAGYIFGGTSHAIAFALLNLILAIGLGLATSTSLTHIFIKQMFLFSFALMIWSMSAMGTLVARKAFMIIMVVLIMGSCAGGFAAYMILPGLAILVSPMFNETIFQFATSSRGFSMAYPASLLLQAAFFFVFFIAACRSYRGTYRLTFSIPLAMALLATWAIASVCGQVTWGDFFFREMFRQTREPQFVGAQVVATLLAAMLIAIVPLSSILVESRRNGRKLVSFLSYILVILLIMLSTIGANGSIARDEGALTHLDRFEVYLVTTLVVAAYVAGAIGLLALVAPIKIIFKVILVIFIGVLSWVGPLLLELIQALIMARHDENPHFGLLANFSPVGSLVNTWTQNSYYSRIPGLIGQCILAAVLLALGIAAERRRRKIPIIIPPVNPQLPTANS